MLEISGLHKTYGQRVKAVDGIDLSVREGEIFGFIGPNGAGKTTTIKMITGIIRPDGGSIRINGFDLSDSPLAAKQQVGFVPDTSAMFLRLKGIEYLNFMGDMYSVSTADRQARIEDLAKEFDMASVLADPIQSYSHGMRQKIVVIGVLLHQPPVWIMDEPMTGLDPRSSFKLKQMMREHAHNGNTVFFSTHVLEVAETLCTRVAIINKGKILFCGDMESMREHFRTHASLENIFLELTSDAE